MKKYLLAVSFVLALFLWACSNSLTSGDESGTLETTIMRYGPDLYSRGELNAAVSADSFLSIFEYGDIVTVIVAKKDTFDALVGGVWNDVFSGEYVVVVEEGRSCISFGMSAGVTAVDLGFAKYSKDKSGHLFEPNEDLNSSLKVEFIKKRNDGFPKTMIMRGLEAWGYEREMFPILSEAEYANFRDVSTPGMGAYVLYRSSSPIDPSLGRNEVSDFLISKVGIATILNLTDTEERAREYEGYKDTYYSKQKIAFLDMFTAFASPLFKDGFVKGLRFMIENEGPYLVHCTLGKDRTGLVIAVLEALMGADIEDIKKDYGKSYTNFFVVMDGVQQPLPEDDIAWFSDLIAKNIRFVYESEGVALDESFDNLTSATEKYLQRLGLSKSEIEALKERLKYPNY